MIIKSIEPISCAKVGGVVYALLGFVIGVLFSLISSLGLGAAASGMSSFGPLFGVGAVVILPILYGVLGFVAGFISALCYNAAAKFVGGIILEVE